MYIRTRRNDLGERASWDAQNEQARRLIDYVETPIPIKEKALFTVQKGPMTPQRTEWINELILRRRPKDIRRRLR